MAETRESASVRCCLQAETLRLESEKLSEMSGDDSEELNELLKVKIRELAEASAIAATADSLQKELNEKVKEAIDLQTRFSAAEAAQKEQSRELEDLRAKLRDLHSEALAQPPLVRYRTYAERSAHRHQRKSRASFVLLRRKRPQRKRPCRRKRR